MHVIELIARVPGSNSTHSDVTFNLPNERISVLSGAMLTIADQKLQGFGQIGSGSVELINAVGGLIDANSHSYCACSNESALG